MNEEFRFEKLNKNEETVLINTFAYYRLLRDFERVEKKIGENEPKDYSADPVLKKMWKKNVVNPIRRVNTSDLSERKQKIFERTEEFLSRVQSGEFDEAAAKDEALLKEKTEKIFEDDTSGVKRLFFALTLFVVGNAVTYEDKEGTLADVSRILFDDETRMSALGEALSENYSALNGKGFTELEKGLVAGVGLSLIVASVTVPVLAVGKAAGSACITSVLAQLGHSASGVITAGVLAVEKATLIAGVSLLGITLLGAGIETAVREEKTKAAFRKLTPTDLKFLFAVNATVLQQLKSTMDAETYKNSLNGCLDEIDFLRSDAQYLLLAERIDAADNKAKIETCNRMVSRMAAIVGI